MTTADGAEALDKLQSEAGRFDLLLADVVMPGIDGVELAKLAARILPDLKIVFIDKEYRYWNNLDLSTISEVTVHYKDDHATATWK